MKYLRILVLAEHLKQYKHWVKEQIDNLPEGYTWRKFENKFGITYCNHTTEYRVFTPRMGTDSLRGCRYDELIPLTQLSDNEMMWLRLYVLR
jgi:hypothetical protein